MQTKVIELVIKNLILPLALKLVGDFFDSKAENESKEELKETKLKRKELINKIKKAQTNEEIINLSTELHDLNVGKMRQQDSKGILQ